MPDVKPIFFLHTQSADETQRSIKENFHLVHIKTKQSMTVGKLLYDT